MIPDFYICLIKWGPDKFSALYKEDGDIARYPSWGEAHDFMESKVFHRAGIQIFPDYMIVRVEQ